MTPYAHAVYLRGDADEGAKQSADGRYVRFNNAAEHAAWEMRRQNGQ